MNELSLFSGAGGGLLGTKILGWRHVGYVEWNDHCQKVIAQRIKDGFLENAPIFTDIRAFVDSGCAQLYRGVAQVVSAGFPCQPHSQAGKRLGADDERDRWPDTIEVIREVRPDFCLLENVPGLLANGYAGTVFGQLAESGYDANWSVLGGYATNSCCESERLWIVAAKTDSAVLESLDLFKRIASLVRKNHADGNIQEQSARCFSRMITPTSNEILMQWPKGWSGLKPLETGKFREWLREHGQC